jgi:hypothetical protein
MRCPACGRIGLRVVTVAEERYLCRTSGCVVIEFDQNGIRRRAGEA